MGEYMRAKNAGPRSSTFLWVFVHCVTVNYVASAASSALPDSLSSTGPPSTPQSASEMTSLPSTADTSVSERTSMPPTTNTNATAGTNMSEQEIQSYLESLERETNRQYIPAIVYLLLLAVVGAPGNLLVVVVYAKFMPDNPMRLFIIAIAAFDLVTNLLVIPGDVHRTFHTWNFDHPVYCKLRMGITAFATIASAIILFVVAVTRYRKICQPFKAQVTVPQAKLTCLGVLCLSALFAIPFAVINGRQTKDTPIPGIKGVECRTDDRYLPTKWPMLVLILYLLIFVSLCSLIIALYALVGLRAYKHRQMRLNRVRYCVAPSDEGKRKKNSTKFKRRKGGSESSSSGVNKGGSLKVEAIRDGRDQPTSSGTESSRVSGQPTNSATESSCQSDQLKSKSGAGDGKENVMQVLQEEGAELATGSEGDGTCQQRKQAGALEGDTAEMEARSRSDVVKPNKVSADTGHQHREASNKLSVDTGHSGRQASQKTGVSRTTFMLFLVSAVFVIGFVPHFCTMFFRYLNRSKFKAMSGAAPYFYNLFNRSIYLNSAANPIIYSFLDSRFRQFTRQLFGCGKGQGTRK